MCGLYRKLHVITFYTDTDIQGGRSRPSKVGFMWYEENQEKDLEYH